MKNKVLFISATHGDEGFSIPVLNVLEKRFPKTKYGYSRIIGNPNAFKLNIRQTQGNLNRSAPGNPKSLIYEERRAFKIMQIAKKYSYVIDLHGADSNCGIVIILCNPILPNFILAGMLNIKRIIIWRTKEDLVKGPLTQFCPTGLEIECGKKADSQIQKGLEKILSQFLQSYQTLSPKKIMKNLKEKEIFQIYDKLAGKDRSLQDFKQAKRNNDSFYPFMSNLYPGIACYKMKKVDFAQLFLEQSWV